MADPPLRRDFVDASTPPPNRISAVEYNLNAQRTDEAWDYAQGGTTVGEAIRTAVDAAAQRAAMGAVGNSELIVNIKDHGAVGDGVADDTAAIQAALNAVANGGTVLIPEGVFAYSGELALPLGAKLQGSGLNRWAANGGTRLRAIHADALIRLTTNCSIQDVMIDGGFVANWGIYFNSQEHTMLAFRVSVIKCNQVAFVFDRTQNSMLFQCSSRDTPVGFGFYNGAAVIESYGCSYDNSANAGAGYGGTSSRAILITNDIADPRMNGEVAQQGNREISFFGGIYERGPGDYRVEILNGGPGNIRFIGAQVAGSANSLAVMHVGSNYPGNVVLSDVMWAFVGDEGTTKLAIVEGGTLIYRNIVMNGAVNRNLMTRTVVSGNGTVYYDEISRFLVNSSFEANLKAHDQNGFWGNVGTGVGVWNAAKKCLEMTLPNTTNGVDVRLIGYQYYGEPYRLVTIRFGIANASGKVRLSISTSSSWITIGEFGNGFHEVVYQFTSDERRIAFYSPSMTAVTADLLYFRCEHGAETAGAQPLAAGTTIPSFNIESDDTTVTRISAGRIAVEGNTVGYVLSNTATLDFGSVAAQSFADLTIAVAGAAAGDSVALGVPVEVITAGIIYSAWVSAADTVTVRAHNYTAGALDPASGTFKATIVR